MVSLYATYEITSNKNSGPLKKNKRKRREKEKPCKEVHVKLFYYSMKWLSISLSLFTKVLQTNYIPFTSGVH